LQVIIGLRAHGIGVHGIPQGIELDRGKGACPIRARTKVATSPNPEIRHFISRASMRRELGLGIHATPSTLKLFWDCRRFISGIGNSGQRQEGSGDQKKLFHNLKSMCV
jgi:hypothetical protein